MGGVFKMTASVRLIYIEHSLQLVVKDGPKDLDVSVFSIFFTILFAFINFIHSDYLFLSSMYNHAKDAIKRVSSIVRYIWKSVLDTEVNNAVKMCLPNPQKTGFFIPSYWW
jgi:hypothetical protein